MKNKFLFAFDLDGTLLYDWAYITQNTIDYIKRISDDGHIVIIVTGRPYRSSIQYYNALQLNTPLVNYNGALITNPTDPTFPKLSININKNKLIQLLNEIDEWALNYFCEVEDNIYLKWDQEEINHLLHLDGGTLFIGEFKDILTDNPHGCILIAKEGKEDYIEQYINTHFSDHIKCRNWGHEYSQVIELFSPKVSKGNALQYVMDYYKIDAQKTIAFGDAHNDIEMIQLANQGIAMINSHSSLLEVADQITEKDNKNDGVIDYIEKYIFKNKNADD